MPATLPQFPGQPTAGRTIAEAPAGPGSAWAALERLLDESRRGGRSARLTRLLLESILSATGAEAALMAAEPGGEIIDAVGPRAEPRGRFARLLPWLRDRLAADADRLLADDLPPGLVAPGPAPSTAVAVRLDRPLPALVVALGGDGGRPLGPAELPIVWSMATLHARHAEHERAGRKLKDTLIGLIQCLTAAIDAKDPYTRGHSERVARIAVRIGREMGLGDRQLSDLYIAGLLHDVGKIGMRDAVLQKPGRLTDEELAHVREHPVVGDRIVSSITQLQYLRPGVRSHHERYDGRGYPDGLAGDAIAPMARILAVADSCDAMLSTRRYRPGLPCARVEELLAEGAGTQWDPEVVRHFLACRSKVYAIGDRGLGGSVAAAVDDLVASRTA